MSPNPMSRFVGKDASAQKKAPTLMFQGQFHQRVVSPPLNSLLFQDGINSNCINLLGQTDKYIGEHHSQPVN